MAHVGTKQRQGQERALQGELQALGSVLGKEHQPLGDSRQVKGKKYGRVTRYSALDDRNDQSRKIN